MYLYGNGLAAVERDRTWRAGEAENPGTCVEACCVAVDDVPCIGGSWQGEKNKGLVLGRCGRG